MIIEIRDRVHVGNEVSDCADPRHVGVIRKIERGIAEIVWNESGFVSLLATKRLDYRGSGIASPMNARDMMKRSKTFSDVPGPVECGERWDEDRD